MTMGTGEGAPDIMTPAIGLYLASAGGAGRPFFRRAMFAWRASCADRSFGPPDVVGPIQLGLGAA